jgi:lysozyme
MAKRRTKVLISAAVVITLIAAAIVLWERGILMPNGHLAEAYAVKGVDVSSYQGDIDWAVLSESGIRFAFIKATEGSGYVDPRFAENYKNAAETDLRIGAYHFFSYESGGGTQADLFIATVPRVENMLPPVVDVEFYGYYEQNPPSREAVIKELTVLIARLKAHYHLRPIIYASEESYRLYISNGFEDCDIWIRNVFTKPSMPDRRDWTFWQYTDRATLDGYSGEEAHIDMNVFVSTAEEFERYGRLGDAAAAAIAKPTFSLK